LLCCCFLEKTGENWWYFFWHWLVEFTNETMWIWCFLLVGC
jgi:hypothetical protein